MQSDSKLDKLRRTLTKMESALVCYSGGVDSAFLLRIAHEQLANNVWALIAVSPSLAQRELDDAKALAATMGVQLIVVDSYEVQNPQYKANPVNRCYHCKSELLRIADQVKQQHNIKHILLGTNADELTGHRPGLQAAEEHQVRHPLCEAELTKDEIRQLSKSLGLPTWDKPQMACLASRFPYGTTITPERLSKVEAFEAALTTMGFIGVRVRYHDTIARLELSPQQLSRAIADDVRLRIIETGKSLGFTYVTLDLAGYRTGSMNETLHDNI